MSVGMPTYLYLEEFGSQIWSAFGTPAYLVGSALHNKNEWRDVDIRLILSDEEYKKWNLGDPKYPLLNVKWISLCMAYSALGERMTHLPIDFQIQQQTLANEQYKSQRRSSIGHVPLRMTDEDFERFNK